MCFVSISMPMSFYPMNNLFILLVYMLNLASWGSFSMPMSFYPMNNLFILLVYMLNLSSWGSSPPPPSSLSPFKIYFKK